MHARWNRRHSCGALVAIALSTAPLASLAQTTLAGVTLRLNGAGLRYRAVFQVYAAALCLSGPATSAEDVYKEPDPQRLRLVILSTVQANELGKLFVKSISDSIDIDWVPGTGTVICVKGQTMTESFPDPQFYQAMMRIWLCNNTADWKLKIALLGLAPT